MGFLTCGLDRVICLPSREAYNKAGLIFDLLSPKSLVDCKKERLGGLHDGGYVMAEIPEHKQGRKIAYSFGISDYDPWSLEMVKRGYEVFQYDGTVEKGPYNDPHIHFFRYMITGSSIPQDNERNLRQIIRENGHDGDDIMLNIDIEGAEWDFFASLGDADMSQFEQIVVEFHNINITVNDDASFEKQKMVLQKMNRTHQVIHLHGNNCGSVTVLSGLRLLPSVMEVTYVRRIDPAAQKPEHEFAECSEEFPGDLDSSNDPLLPDISLGRFNELGDKP
jgi:hypothetical protein